MKKIFIFIVVLALLSSLASCKDKGIPDTNNIVDKTIDTSDGSSVEYSLDNETNKIQQNVEHSDKEDSGNTDVNDFGGGENSICAVHNFSYHWYDSSLISYIGEDSFMSWVQSTGTEDIPEGCISSHNVYKCLEYFDVPDEVIIELYKNDYLNNDWDMEALLARNEIAFEESARQKATPEYHHKYKKLESEIKFKREIFRRISELKDQKSIDYYDSVTNNGTTYPVYNVTIWELVSNTSLTKNDLKEALAFATSYDGIENYHSHYDYNFDLLFGSGISVLNNNLSAIDPKPYESEIMLADGLLHITDNTVTS